MTRSTGRGLGAGELARCGLFAALMAVCAWVCVPTAVPFTLQTLGVFLAVGLLGGRLGTLSVAVYLLLGAVGLPVFAHFTGGVGVLLGSTGGYLLGFLATAGVMWALEGPGRRHPAWQLASMALGLLACYAIGTAWFLAVYTARQGPVALWTVLGWCVLPFLPVDLMKMILAFGLTRRIRGAMGGSSS